VVGQDPQPPGLLEVVIDVPEEGESVIGLGTGLDFERGLQVARGSVEVASTHRLPTGDDEAVSRGRPHEPMIGPPSAKVPKICARRRVLRSARRPPAFVVGGILGVH
jgi:hypothetical protein